MTNEITDKIKFAQKTIARDHDLDPKLLTDYRNCSDETVKLGHKLMEIIRDPDSTSFFKLQNILALLLSVSWLEFIEITCIICLIPFQNM